MATKKKSTTKAKTKRASTTKKTTTRATKKPVKKSPKKKVTSSAKVTSKATKKPAAKTTKKPTKNTLMPLKKLHIFGALLSAVLTGLVIGYGNDVTVSITSSYLANNALTQTGDLLLAYTELFTVNLAYVIAAVLFAAAFWRALLATSLFETYSAQVNKKFTSLNWLELALFGPWILVIIAAAIGVRDVMTLLLMGGMLLATAVLGYLTDRYTLIGNDTWLKKYIIAKILLLPWLVIGVSLWHTSLYGFVTLDAKVYALVGASALTYLLIAFMHRQQIGAIGRFKNFVLAEKVISGLHLVLLALLAAVAFV